LSSSLLGPVVGFGSVLFECLGERNNLEAFLASLVILFMAMAGCGCGMVLCISRFVMGDGAFCTAEHFVNFGSISVVCVVLLFISTRKTRRVGVGVVCRVSCCVVCPKTGAIRQLTEDKLDATCWRALWDGFCFNLCPTQFGD